MYDIKNSNAQYDQGLCIYILNNSLMNDPMYYYVTFEFHMNYGNPETSGVEKNLLFIYISTGLLMANDIWSGLLCC